MATKSQPKSSMASRKTVSTISSQNGGDENNCPRTSVSSQGAANGKAAATVRSRRKALCTLGNASQQRGHDTHPHGFGAQNRAVPKRGLAALCVVVYEDVEPENAAGSSALDCVSLKPCGDETLTELLEAFDNAPSLPANASMVSPMILNSPCYTAGSDRSCEVQEDTEVVHDPLVLSEYSDHVFIYMCTAEVRYRPRATYMAHQQDLSYAMRAVLVDWLSDVVSEYGLQRETLHLAVGYSDRFLSRMSVSRAKLQLLGATALFVAAKYEEIEPPDAQDIAYTTADTYSVQQVLRMEQLLLLTLSFDLAAPTFCQFLRFYAHRLSTPREVVSLAMYLGELSLLDGQRYLPIIPSILSAAALGLASLINGHEWPSDLEKLTRYSLETLEPCIAYLHMTHRGKNDQCSAFKNYKSPKNYSVARIPPLSVLPWNA